jgi:hypothetical protein
MRNLNQNGFEKLSSDKNIIYISVKFGGLNATHTHSAGRSRSGIKRANVHTFRSSTDEIFETRIWNNKIRLRKESIY